MDIIFERLVMIEVLQACCDMYEEGLVVGWGFACGSAVGIVNILIGDSCAAIGRRR